MSDADVQFVMKNTRLREGDARLLIGTVLAHHKLRSIEAERDALRAFVQELADAVTDRVGASSQEQHEIDTENRIGLKARALLAPTPGVEESPE